MKEQLTRKQTYMLPEKGLLLRQFLAEIEYNFILQALERHQNIKTKAALELGITRGCLIMKMKRYGLPLNTPWKKREEVNAQGSAE